MIWAWFWSSPIGRALAAAGVAIVAVLAIYTKGKREGRFEERADAQADALKRTSDAIRAGDHAAVTPDRLRDNDGHRRD